MIREGKRNCSFYWKLTYQNRITFSLVHGETLHIQIAPHLSYEVAKLMASV
jgi:hypothetical protein